jgi:hypothetical protein
MIKPLAALAMAALSLNAQAYQFEFTARVNYTDGSLSGVSLGTVFSGAFSGEGAYEPYTSFWRGYYQFAPGAQLTGSIAGHSVVASSPYAVVYDNMHGNVEDGFTISGGYPLVIDGKVLSDGVFGFNLTTKPGNTGVINGFGLPDEINVAAFDGHSSLTYGYLRRDGGQTGGILSFEVLSVSFPGATVSSTVPEPASWAFMGVGLLGLTGLTGLTGMGALARRSARA